MNLHLTIDRFEGTKKDVAVLLTDDGRSILFPRDLLPKGAKAGEVLALSLARDLKATAAVAAEAKAVRDDLAKTDPGGDIRL